MIYVIDELITKKDVDAMSSEFAKFLWQYGNAGVPEGEPFFGRLIYHVDSKENLSISPSVQTLVDQGIEFLSKNLHGISNITLHRILANGQLPSQPASAHEDWHDQTMATLVYYVSNSEGGGTQFFDNNKVKTDFVDFKQGRAVIFPSLITHQGIEPTLGWRISLGIMYKLHIGDNK
jgi:hypothetical protein